MTKKTVQICSLRNNLVWYVWPLFCHI